ncbi:type I-E CRISPR-associated endonuclease Cas1e [Allosalinactinospora lopnorensis]|uniref:type I-E CRISPR-associated endonuclease Cas1e n=1 Tax=Allosalinactinospora lopnorensis TaxID=1352348 RepID=UPI000623C104|nr:type I-E CRISPR-associated endonuclease Cas1e [Allosalinactinospora lopnorensis]
MARRLPKTLGAPTAVALPRVADRLGFLYLDTVQIKADRNGVCALVEFDDGEEERVYLPTAGIGCVLLGPGTSTTHAAVKRLTSDGAVIVHVGDGGVRCYSAFLNDSTSTRLLDRQVEVVSDTERRLAAAKRLFTMRFSEPLPEGLTLDKLRGLEGRRMKVLYRTLAQQHRIPRFKRSYDPADFDAQDPVNKALTSGNQALYGIATSVILSLGASPALGILHHGQQRAFALDIADLYKAETTVPLAFSLHKSTDPERAARLSLREEFRLLRLIPRMVSDIYQVLDLPSSDSPGPPDVINLWDPDGELPSGVNYATEADR